MRRFTLLIFLFVFLLPVTASGQDFSVHTVGATHTGDIGGQPLTFSGGASAQAVVLAPFGASAGIQYSSKRLTASLGPTYRAYEGSNVAIDVLLSGVYSRDASIINGTQRKQHTGGVRFGFRTGTYPLSALLAIEHTGSAIFGLNTRHENTSVLMGFGVSF